MRKEYQSVLLQFLLYHFVDLFPSPLLTPLAISYAFANHKIIANAGSLSLYRKFIVGAQNSLFFESRVR